MRRAKRQRGRLFEARQEESRGGEARNHPEKTKRHANDLSEGEWIRNSILVWSDIRKGPQEEQLDHPALFPELLVR